VVWRRAAAALRNLDLSKLTGKSQTPGPGSYVAPSSVGKQALGRCSSHAQFSFGTQKQRESAAKATPSPGPVYEPRNARYGPMDRAAYSFGNEIRIKNRDAAMRTPGPGVYNAASACGHQVSSTAKTASSPYFGQPSIGGAGRSVTVLEGRHSPGPIYMGAVACRKQALSTRRSAAHMVFSRADRFRVAVGSNDGPGPGEYIV
jgi:hypothetical protein